MNVSDIKPVYLIQGFLESGKTSFFSSIISKSSFSQGNRILLLLCEDGECEYDTSQSECGNIYIRTIDSKEDLTKENLLRLADECCADRIAIEYNGMWHLADLVKEMPDDWVMFQIVTVIDGSTFEIYSSSFRSLVADKLNTSDLVMVNRFEGHTSPETLHTAIRKINRRAAIYYMYNDGHVEQDNIADPLPYDISSDHFEVNDEDYAIFYSDITDAPEKYNEKTVSFKAMIMQSSKLTDGIFAVGRYIMTCCEADMKLCLMVAEYSPSFTPKEEHWVKISAEIEISPDMGGGRRVPLLHIVSLSDCEPPESKIALFA